jgi:hypothetical protein
MKTMPKRFPVLCAAASLILCTVLSFSFEAEAKGKRGRKASKRSAGRVSKHSRGRRSVAAAPQIPSDYSVVPDEIEVLEHGSSTTRDLAKWLNPPSKSMSASFVDPAPVTSSKRRNVKIDSTRVIQIQQALASRGYFQAEMTGAYDEATIESMRRFQADNRFVITGYPTAQALRSLGLTNW